MNVISDVGSRDKVVAYLKDVFAAETAMQTANVLSNDLLQKEQDSTPLDIPEEPMPQSQALHYSYHILSFPFKVYLIVVFGFSFIDLFTKTVYLPFIVLILMLAVDMVYSFNEWKKDTAAEKEENAEIDLKNKQRRLDYNNAVKQIRFHNVITETTKQECRSLRNYNEFKKKYLQTTLNKVYECNLIPLKYRNFYCIGTILELFETGRVDTLKEALNKYDDMYFQGNVISSLNQISYYQGMLYSAVQEISHSINSVTDQLTDISKHINNSNISNSQYQNNATKCIESIYEKVNAIEFSQRCDLYDRWMNS